MIAGGHAADHVAVTVGICACAHRIGPVRQGRSVRGFQPDKPPAFVRCHMHPFLRAFAQEILFLLRDGPVQPQILRDHRAIGFIPDHDEPFFSPQNVQTFRAIRHRTQISANRHQRIPEGLPLAGRHRDLVAQFAGEADPVGPHVEPAQRSVSPFHEPKRFGADVHAAQPFQGRARVWPHNRDLRVLFGDVGHIDVPVPPFGLQPFFHVPMDAFGPACRGVTQECVLIDPRHNAVVDQKPVFRTHQPVAAFARLQRRHHVGVKHVQEPARIRPFDNDLAQRRGIEHPKVFAGIFSLPHHRIMHAFAVADIGIGTPPLPYGFPVGAVFFVPVIHRCAAHRLKHMASGLAPDRTH